MMDELFSLSFSLQDKRQSPRREMSEELSSLLFTEGKNQK